MINVLVGGYLTAQLKPLCLPIGNETAFLWRPSCLDTLEAHRAETAENVSAYLKLVNLVRTVVSMH